jgi:hypothetical protein
VDVYLKLKAAVAALRDADLGIVEKFVAVLAFLNAVAELLKTAPPVFGAEFGEPEPATLDECEAIADAGLAEDAGLMGVPVLLLIKIGAFLLKQILKI